MQLPRGTFREIRKKVPLGDLLSELERTQFTGTCGIVAGPATGSFVFQKGSCILARFRGEPGDKCRQAIQQSAGEAVDVILATLDEAQIKLSLEFNPLCVLTGNNTISSPYGLAFGPGPRKTAPAVRSPPHPIPPVHPARSRAVISRESPITSVPHPGAVKKPVLQAGVHPREAAPGEQGPGTSAAAEPDDIESDFDALDSMDLDHVTARIRSDCKTLVKNLQLEHLMER